MRSGSSPRRCCSAMATCSDVTFLLSSMLDFDNLHALSESGRGGRTAVSSSTGYGACSAAFTPAPIATSFLSLQRAPRIGRCQHYPRMSRRPVTTSQTSHKARPKTPTNNSGDPSAMARLPSPAKMGKLPPATPSSRCHGRVKPLA